MALTKKEVPTNFVPAVAVKRGVQALFNVTGRKGHVGCLFIDKSKTAGPTSGILIN